MFNTKFQIGSMVKFIHENDSLMGTISDIVFHFSCGKTGVTYRVRVDKRLYHVRESNLVQLIEIPGPTKEMPNV